MLKKVDKAESEKAYHHGDLRNALISAGLRVLAEHGVSGLNLREVARQAGVSHAAPYRHFADKQALVDAIALDGFTRLRGVIEKALARDRHAPASGRLIGMGQAYAHFAVKHPDHFRVMFSSARDMASNRDLYEMSKFGFVRLVDTINYGQLQGELTTADPLLMAQTIWSMIHGLTVLLIDGQIPQKAPASGKDLDRLLSECMRIGLDGLLRR